MPTDQLAHPPETERFTGFLADTRESRRIHYRIRYQVYCERKGFEDNVLLRRRGLERDSFDGHALPFIMRDNVVGRWRGAARLVLRGDQGLPVEQLGVMPRQRLTGFPPGSVAEVSRLAGLPVQDAGNADRWALVKATCGVVLACSLQMGVQLAVFLITPSLARVLDYLGFPLTAEGVPIEYRGVRRAYSISAANAATCLNRHGVAESFLRYSSGIQSFSEAGLQA